MWQIFAFGSIFFEKIQDAVDKYAIVKMPAVDDLCASFLRTLIYTILLLAIGLTGWFGKIALIGTIPLFIQGVVWTINSVFYTRLLKNVEVSAIGTLSYAGPFIFLLVDAFVLKSHLTLMQVLGIALLVFGALGFVIDVRTHKLRKQFSPKIWGMFLFNISMTGYEGYLFQYYERTQGMSEATFLLSGCVISLLIFITTLFLTGKLPELFSRKYFEYAKPATISKLFDATQSLFWFAAISKAALSQVSAMNAFSPILLLLIIVAMQRAMRLPLNENLERRLFYQKLVATVIVAIGGILVA